MWSLWYRHFGCGAGSAVAIAGGRRAGWGRPCHFRREDTGCPGRQASHVSPKVSPAVARRGSPLPCRAPAVSAAGPVVGFPTCWREHGSNLPWKGSEPGSSMHRPPTGGSDFSGTINACGIAIRGRLDDSGFIRGNATRKDGDAGTARGAVVAGRECV